MVLGTILSGHISGGYFLRSGLLALIGVYIVIQLLTFIIPNYLLLNRKIVFVILGTFVVFQGLYITNIIPPIPLSLKRNHHRAVGRAGW